MTTESASQTAAPQWMQESIADMQSAGSVMEASLKNCTKRQAIMDHYQRCVGFMQMVATYSAELTGESAAMAAPNAKEIGQDAFNSIRTASNQIFFLTLALKEVLALPGTAPDDNYCSRVASATDGMLDAVETAAQGSATLSESIARIACKRMFPN